MKSVPSLAAFLLVGLALAQGAPKQPDPKSPEAPKESWVHSERDPYKCPKCRPALDKAVSFARKNVGGAQVHGKVFAGMLYLALGDSTGTNNCVQYCAGAVRTSGGNRNWYLGLCMYFLSEANLRHPSGTAASALSGALPVAAEQQEETGGWCHYKGMWKQNNYDKIGGGKDLGMITSMVYASFWNMKAAGLAVPANLEERVLKNLESISDGHGFCYGTGNKWGDITMSRGSYTLLGLINANKRDHPFFSKIESGYANRLKDTGKGHALAPLHWYGVGAGLYHLGRYKEFADQWLDHLLGLQKPEGWLSLECDRGDKYLDKVANAAVLGLLLLFQKDGILDSPGKKKAAPKSDKPDSNRSSPFARPKSKSKK